MATDAQKRAAKALAERREAEGLKKVTLWLSAEARFKLDALKKAAGSKDKVADAAILAWEGPGVAKVARAEPTLTKVTVEPETMKALQRTHSRATLRKPLEITGEGENKMRMPRAPVGSRLKGSKK